MQSLRAAVFEENVIINHQHQSVMRQASVCNQSPSVRQNESEQQLSSVIDLIHPCKTVCDSALNIYQF